MRWLDQIVESTLESESPERFQYWSALCAVSAVVKKNLYLDRFYYKLYPNIYVFLVARSGLRKSNPVTLAKKLVEETMATRIIAGRNTVQAVLRDLGKAQSIHGGGVLKDASGFMVSGELASFLVKDPDALTILTDLYDTYANEPEWKNTLKSGTDSLRNPCLTLLGATNEDHFKDAVPQNAIGGGFIARTIIVYENQRRTINSLMDAPKVTPVIKDLACYLKEIAKIQGQFKLAPEARDWFRDWYGKLSIMDHQDRTGSLERLGDTVLKVAMLLCLSETLELEIKEHHVIEAAEKCQECIAGLKHVTMGQGRNELAYATALLLKFLISRPEYKATKKNVLAKFWGEFDSVTLDRIAETLQDSGGISITRAGKEVIYQMHKRAVEAYTKFKAEIN